jgi:small subunit ribosomal protein S20
MLSCKEEKMSTRLKNYAKKNLRNKHFVSQMKTERKKYLSTVKTGDMAEKKIALAKIDSTIQKLKSKGIIHKNKASRLISRLAKRGL